MTRARPLWWLVAALGCAGLIQAGLVYRHLTDRVTYENEAGDSAAFDRVLRLATATLSVGFVFEL